MSGLKLFRGGYGQYKYYIVAKDVSEAIKEIQEKYNMLALPVVAEEIQIDGYNIVAVDENKTVEEVVEQVKEEIKIKKETKKSKAKK